MSPEQIEAKELDGRSDIFFARCGAYEMLAGQRAFQGNSQLSVASASSKRTGPISIAKPMTPPALDHSINKCLAKSPTNDGQAPSDLASEQSGSARAARTMKPRRRSWGEPKAAQVG